MTTWVSLMRGIVVRCLRLIRSNGTVSGLVLAVLVGVIAGLGAVVFRWLIRTIGDFFFHTGGDLLGFMGDYYIILLPTIGGLFVGLLVYYGAREAKGHGVPEVMEAVVARGGRIRPRVAAVKALASAICIGSGGSVGREGPIVQIGSSFGSSLGQWLKLPEESVRILVACGAAGGISATFNAPIGGVFFAMEIILGRFITPNFGYVVVSSVVADVISQVFLGDLPAFQVVPYTLVSYWELLPYALLGVASALAAVAFMRLLYKFEDLFDAWRFPEFLKPMIGGILVGVIGLYSHDLLGVGYGDVPWASVNSIDHALLGNIALPTLAVLFVLKIVATSTTLGSGGSGGIFAPSLFIGAVLGGIVGIAAHTLFPELIAPSGAYALVGMAAVFAGGTRAPITAIIMMFEMTMDYKIILPLMIAVVISTFVSRLLNRETIYTEKLMRRGINITQLEQSSPLRNVTAGEAMTRNYPTVLPTMSVNEVVTRMRRTDHHGFPVVDENGDLVGMITLAAIEAAMAEGDVSQRTVQDVMSSPESVSYPDEKVHDVFWKWGTQEVVRVPVVSRDNPKHLLGVLRRHDIIAAYSKAMKLDSRD